MQNLFLVQSLLFPARNTCHTGTDKGSKNFVFSIFFINCFYFLHTITMVRTCFAETSTYNKVNIVKNNHNNVNEMGEKSSFFLNKCFIFLFLI